MNALSTLRALPGPHGTWLLRGAQAVLISTDTDLTSPPTDMVVALAEEGLLSEDHSTYGATVMLTTRCNLTCEYCYQNERLTERAPARIPTRTLAANQLDALTEFIRRQMATYEKSELSLLLTGGEPLLQFRTCLDLLEALTPLGLGAVQMFTNAVLLTPARAQALQQAGLTHLQVSFDRAQPDHDRYRKNRSGIGTYDRTLRNILAALDVAPSVDYVARINVSASNVPGLEQLIDDLAGRLGTDRICLRFGLLDDIGIGFVDAPGSMGQVRDLLMPVVLLAVDLGFTVDPLASVEDCLYCGVVGGGSGCVINADGTLYSCWESVGRSGYEVGDINHGYLTPEQLSGRWVDCSYNVTTARHDRTALSALCDAIDLAVLDRTYERSLPTGATP